MRTFLLHVCECAIAGHSHEIHEQQIGSSVFGRKPDYNPSEDNIVRVEARNLRKRLEEYFEHEGACEPVVITVPKGGYVPVFEPRPEVTAPPAVRSRSRFSPWVLVALPAIVCLMLGWRVMRAPTGAEPSPIWSQLFDPAHTTLIAVADSHVALYQDLAQKDVALEQYMGGKYLPPVSDEWLSIISRRHYTSLADATLAARIAQVNAASAGRTEIRYARSLEIRDFKSGHVILFGSKRANPWVELFEPQMNFLLQYDTAHRRALVRNRAPRPGEAREYYMESSDRKNGRAYAVIAFLPNLARTGNVLIIQGLNMEATEAAGEMVLSPQLTQKLLDAVGGREGKPLIFFEALLRLRAVGGAAKDTEIVAVRRPAA